LFLLLHVNGKIKLDILTRTRHRDDAGELFIGTAACGLR
jgi:hypothetical protein